jgi:TonB family protein
MKVFTPKLILIAILLFPLGLWAQVEKETEKRGATETIVKRELPVIAPKAQNIEILDPLKYPLKAVRKKIEGKVVVDIEVDENGSYQAHNITESADDILAEAVDPYMHKLIFHPAMQGEEAVPGVARIKIVFSIQSRIPIKTEITIKFEGQ